MRLTKLLTKTTFVCITVIKIKCSEICILYHILEIKKKKSNSIDPHKWNQVISSKDEDNIMEKTVFLQVVLENEMPTSKNWIYTQTLHLSQNYFKKDDRPKT